MVLQQFRFESVPGIFCRHSRRGRTFIGRQAHHYSTDGPGRLLYSSADPILSPYTMIVLLEKSWRLYFEDSTFRLVPLEIAVHAVLASMSSVVLSVL